MDHKQTDELAERLLEVMYNVGEMPLPTGIKVDPEAVELEMVESEPPANKCTCGVDSLGYGVHSNWCDKDA